MTTSAEIGPAAVALSDLLAALTAADLVAIRGHIDTVAPGMLDQADAAAVAVEGRMQQYAAEHGALYRRAAADEIPEWIRFGVVEALVTFSARRATTCQHAPDPARPQPVYAAAWRPGVIACAACCGFLFRLAGDRDRTCDRCGHIERERGVYPCSVALGPLTFMFGLCHECRPDVTPEATS
ncbi:hypothetical protein FMEAI12_3560026 [Parafrankia sp. Ea1.12]|uniref:hypothetical protein n=1 Tax=Parafrankia sp. Ea1.12 TaxID=573499 RepID=UPI000DA4F613|nr:hypothetical protein [Parafrankia sp. Ea1.12]SQD96281.1 hypothetical protein FMEAI12_3560026 [Parafrankia sp. Ea1.12]